MNRNVSVQIIPLTTEEIEKYTSQKHKKRNISTLLHESIPSTEVSIKQEIEEDTKIDIHGIAKKDNLWQSSVQEFGIKDEEVEDTDEVEIITEEENQIIPITKDTTFSNNLENVNGNEFSCNICNTNLDNFEEILVHKNVLHKSKPYVCNVCNAQFALSAHLFVHQVKSDNDQCMRNLSVNPSEIQSSSKSNWTINPRRFYKNTESTPELAKESCNTNTSINLQKNVSNKLNKKCITDPNITLQKTKCKSLKCLKCGLFSTRSKATFRNHLNICNNISKSSFSFQCNLCIKSFKTHQALNAHSKYHVNRLKIISKKEERLEKIKLINPLKNRVALKSQKNVSPNNGRFNTNHWCKYCNRHFSTRVKLNMHQKQHKQQMICCKCNKKFVLNKNFEKHLLLHTNVIMSNSISVSGTKKNKRTDDKRKKQNTLLDTQMFHCSDCNIYYKSKQCLTQHKIQHHSGSKPLYYKLKSKCNWCSLTITKSNMLRHIRAIHPNINPVKCSYCPMAFKNRASLTLHKVRYH